MECVGTFLFYKKLQIYLILHIETKFDYYSQILLTNNGIRPILRIVLKIGVGTMIYKSSKQRELVLGYMKNVEGHVSAEQIFHDLSTMTSISLATVYRNLNILVEMNEIKKLAHPTYGYVYDKTCNPHYHFHCVKCNELSDLDTSYLEEINQIAEKCGLDVVSHTILFTGTCQKCQKKN